MDLKSNNLVIKERGTQIIPWDHICCGLSVQTIGSRFAPKTYKKLCESIDYSHLSYYIKNIPNEKSYETYNQNNSTNIENVVLGKDFNGSSHRKIEILTNQQLLAIDDKLIPKNSTQLTNKSILNKYIDQKLIGCENSDQIIESLLKEFESQYILAVKTSIIDYVLENKNIFKEFQIKTFKLWKNSKNSFENIKHLNCSSNYSFDPIITEITHLWNQKYTDLNIFDWDFPKNLNVSHFKSIITQNCQKINFKLKYEWISECNQILINKNSKVLTYESIENLKYLNAIASVMFKLFRQLITKNLNKWIDILTTHLKSSKPIFMIDIKLNSSNELKYEPKLDDWMEILLFPSKKLIEYINGIERIESNQIVWERSKLKLGSKFILSFQTYDIDLKDHTAQISSIIKQLESLQTTEKLANFELISKCFKQVENVHKFRELSKLKFIHEHTILNSIFEPNEKNLGIFKINLRNFKLNTEKLIEFKIESKLNSKIVELLSLAKHICSKMSEMEKIIKNESNSSHQLISNWKTNKLIKSQINLMMFDILIVENNWNSIIETRFKNKFISESDIEVLHKLYNWPKRIRYSFIEKEENYENDRRDVENKLNNRTLLIENQIQNLNNLLNDFEKKRISSPFECIEDNCKELNDTEIQLKNMIKEINEINDEKIVLKCPTIDFTLLEQMMAKVNRLNNIWKTTLSFKQLESNCLSESVRKMDINIIGHKIDDLLVFCDQMIESNIDSKDILQNANCLHTDIDSFKTNYIPLIEIFSSKVLKERHWHQIDEIIGQQISLKVNTTFGEVISISNPKKYIEQIKSLNKTALKEYQLELLLEKMKNEYLDDWPSDAFDVIANKFLETESFDLSVREDSIKALKYIHLDSLEFIRKINKIKKNGSNHSFCVTPSLFIEVISIFKELLKQKQNQIFLDRKKYSNGIKSLDSVIKRLKLIRNQIIGDFQPLLMSSFIETEKMMIRIEKKTLNIEIEKEIMATDESIANQSAASAQNIKDECYKELSRAVPAIKNAINALNTIKPEDITLLRSMRSPPLTVRYVLEAVCILNGYKPEKRFDRNTNVLIEDYWSVSLKMLSDVKFLSKLKNFNRNGIQQNSIDFIRQKYLHSIHFESSSLKRVSKACEGLAQWVKAIDIYDKLINVIKPKRHKLKESQNKLISVFKTLDQKRVELRNTTDSLQQLKDEFSKMTKKKKELEHQKQLFNNKLIQIKSLLDDLKSRKNVWTETCDRLKENNRQLIAEILLGSAVINYISYLNPYERHFCVNKWQQYLENECNFRFSKKFNLIDTFLGDMLEIDKWFESGIKLNLFDIENAIICSKNYRHIIIILSNESQKITKLLNILHQNLKQIEYETEENSCSIDSHIINAIENGEVVLIDNFSKIRSNDLMEQLIESNVITKNTKQFLKFGDQLIPMSYSFKTYIICETIVNLTSKMLSKVFLINWSTNQTSNDSNCVDTDVDKYITELKINIKQQRSLRSEDYHLIELVSDENKFIETYFENII